MQPHTGEEDFLVQPKTATTYQNHASHRRYERLSEVIHHDGSDAAQR